MAPKKFFLQSSYSLQFLQYFYEPKEALGFSTRMEN